MNTLPRVLAAQAAERPDDVAIIDQWLVGGHLRGIEDVDMAPWMWRTTHVRRAGPGSRP